MNAVQITPLKQPVTTTVVVPGSKSYTNRALVMAALTPPPVTLHNPLHSDDTAAMVECLRTLGIALEVTPERIVIQGNIKNIPAREYELYARDSGTTARFLLALLCIVPGIKTIQGSRRLNERPISDLVDALRELGAHIAYCDRIGHFPVRITSSSLSKTAVQLNGALSSQFCSALLLIAPHMAQGLTLHIKGPLISQSYVGMTLECMRDWNVTVHLPKEGIYIVPAHKTYRINEYRIEGDYSSAGYFFAMAVLTQSHITVNNLNPRSAQADRSFLDLLEQMGNEVVYGEESVSVQGKQIMPMNVDMEHSPDQVMTMAVLAAFAQGVSRISGVRSLRYKETERIGAIKNELAKMGIKTEDSHDTLTIYGGKPRAAEIEVYNDHRMAMAFAIAGTRLEGMVIRHPEVVNKTFPAFWDVLRSVG